MGLGLAVVADKFPKELPIKESKSCYFIFKVAEKLLNFEKVAEKLIFFYFFELEVGFIVV